jgi:Tol biopolymer transport system component
MKFYSFSRHGMVITCLLSLLLAACAPGREATIPTSTPVPTSSAEETVLPTLTAIPSEESATGSPVSSTEQSIVVAFVKDGNIHLWDGATNQIQTIVNSGDVIAVTMSDDGQVIAFLRRSVVQLSELEWFEQSALWAVDRNGENPREIISVDSLRQRLNTGQRDSTNIPYMEWLPGTHRLLFSGWKYIVQAEGESHAIPEGLYLVDIDTLTDTQLIPAGNYLRFVPSPDGQQIALMSPDGLSFINIDGNNWRQNVLTYPQAGQGGPLFPTGVWTQDSRAFVITGSFENDPRFNINFNIWRVPVDGSSPEVVATITGSDPRSVTFSPDGQRAAFLQTTEGQPPTIAGWSITPLAAGLGPLAIPDDIEIGNASLHWSPAGDPFTGKLRKLCPDATGDSGVCDARIHFDGTVAAIHWIDGNRLLFLTRDPAVLFLGEMDFSDNRDGTTIPIVAWPVEEWVSPQSFTTIKLSQ